MDSKQTLKARLAALANIDATVDDLATMFDLDLHNTAHATIGRIAQEVRTLRETSLALAAEPTTK